MNYDAVFHVDLDDEKILNLAMSNILNYYKAINASDMKVVLLANGPAVKFFTKESVPQAISDIQGHGVTVCVCNNALKTFSIAPDSLAGGIRVVPAGIVELVELQRAGFAYIKP